MRGREGAVLILVALLAGVASLSAGDEGTPPRARAHGVLANYFGAPISFEPNQGQADSRVKFMARGQGYNLFLTANHAVFSLRHSGEGNDLPPKQMRVLTMSMVGANQAALITGEDELPGKSSYFFSTDPKAWHTNIPNFGKVQYENIYPGIDLVFHGIRGQLEYDFLVRPGATPKAIVIAFTGAKRLQLSPQGELVLQAEKGQICFHKPIAYQRDGENKKPVMARYRFIGKNQIGFVVGVYDSAKPLIIDPVLTMLEPTEQMRKHTKGSRISRRRQ